MQSPSSRTVSARRSALLATPLVALLAAPLAALAAAPASGAPPLALTTAATSRAPIAFEPAVIELGELIAGRPKSAPLTIKNVGDTPITIAAIVASCGCTTFGAAPTEPIGPGKSFTIDVTLDPGFRTGVELSRGITVRLDDGSVATTRVVGQVKTVVRMSPEIVDGSLPETGATAMVRFDSVDGRAFRILELEPQGFAAPTDGARAEHALSIDIARWVQAGRPAKLVVRTDMPDAETLVVPIKATKAVAMFRLPAAESDDASRDAVERVQDDVILALDAKLADAGRGSDFAVRLHRESGMLFVHGSDADVAVARRALRGMPLEWGVREAGR